MKTTVDLPDSLFQEAKACAKSRGVPFRQIIEEGLRAVIDSTGTPAHFRLRDGSYGRPESRAAKHDWTAVREAIYESRGE